MMNRIRSSRWSRAASGLASAFCVALLLVSAVAQASERDRYERHVAKFAATAGPGNLNPREMCICRTDPVSQNVVNTFGYLNALHAPVAPYNSFAVCSVPEFDASGTVVGSYYCGDFVPLRR